VSSLIVLAGGIRAWAFRAPRTRPDLASATSHAFASTAPGGGTPSARTGTPLIPNRAPPTTSSNGEPGGGATVRTGTGTVGPGVAMGLGTGVASAGPAVAARAVAQQMMRAATLR
jgi:hypothetical protein